MIFSKDPIKELCKTVNKQFFFLLDDKDKKKEESRVDRVSAVTQLGNLYRLLRDPQSANYSELVIATLNGIKERLNAEQIKILWGSANNITQDELRIKEKDTKLSILECRKQLFRDPSLFQKVEKDDLIAVGENGIWFRDALIALIRKHLRHQGRPDPFAEGFNYDLIDQGSSEQNFLYVNGFIKKCELLPLEDIARLGKKRSQVAAYILKDIVGSAGYFQVSSDFAYEHQTLRATIAEEWKKYFETMPLPLSLKEGVEKELKELQSKFPEFERVDLGARLSRASRYVDAIGVQRLEKLYLGIGLPPLLTWLFANSQSSFALAAALSTGAPAICTKSLASAALTAAPWSVLPMVAFFGLGWVGQKAYSKRVEQPAEDNPEPSVKLGQRASR